VIEVPFAHIGHALPMLPFFAPPLVLTLGGIVLMILDRLRGGSADR
jgi:ABC-type Fe3+ transport system permease subunit